eukprot:999495-Lingulodinium_polyedra.AAC.1
MEVGPLPTPLTDAAGRVETYLPMPSTIVGMLKRVVCRPAEAGQAERDMRQFFASMWLDPSGLEGAGCAPVPGGRSWQRTHPIPP